MDRSEPTLIPEWLKSTGSSTAGGTTTTHQTASSSSQTDDHFGPKPSRNKSLVNGSDIDIGRSFGPDRTTSSYFRRSSSSNGSANLRSFGRSNRDRDWEKDLFDSREKEKTNLGDHRHRDYFDPLGNILPGRFDKDVLRRSQSMTAGKRGETWPRKVGVDSSSANKSNHSNSNGLLRGGSAVGGVQKAAFEREFPSLGAEEKPVISEIKRVSSPGLSSAIQNLPIGTSTIIGGDGWTSALAEVPVIAGSEGPGGSVHKMAPATTTSVAPGTATGLNMAEKVAQGPPRAPATPQLSAGNQRLEDLAIKQSRQLIPMTPSMPKALVPNPLEKPKPKSVQQQQQSSSHLVNHSPRGAPTKSDVSKVSSLGKLHVLKPARDRNAVSPTSRDGSSPTSVGKVANSPLAVAPSVVASVPLRSPSNKPNIPSTERKPALVTLDKKHISQAQSRNDFFNLMRKKSMMSGSAGPVGSHVASPSVLDKSDRSEDGNALSPRSGEDPAETSTGNCSTKEMMGGMTGNDGSSDGPQESYNNEKSHPGSDAILHSEEEEAAFLRSLGWEENAGEDEGLTEEEISSFYMNAKEYLKSRPTSKISQGLQPKLLIPYNLRTESSGDGAASGSASSSDSTTES